MKMKKTYLSAVAILVCAALVGGIAGTSFYTKRHFKEDIVTGPNVTEVFKLSRYNPNLEGTIGDSDVYVLKGEKEGGSLVVLGSTHANEPSGHMAGIILEENAKVEAGTIYVIPNINNSALTHNDPLDGSPQYMHFTTKMVRPEHSSTALVQPTRSTSGRIRIFTHTSLPVRHFPVQKLVT